MPPPPGSLPRLTTQRFEYASLFFCGLDPSLPPATAISWAHLSYRPEGGPQSPSPLLHRGRSSEQPDTRQALSKHGPDTPEGSFTQPHKDHSSLTPGTGRQGGQRLSAMSRTADLLPNSSSPAPSASFVGNVLKITLIIITSRGESGAIYKAVLPAQALCVLPEAGPRALSRHQLISLTHCSPTPAVFLVPHSASEYQGCRSRGRWLLKLPGSASAVQCN